MGFALSLCNTEAKLVIKQNYKINEPRQKNLSGLFFAFCVSILVIRRGGVSPPVLSSKRIFAGGETPPLQFDYLNFLMRSCARLSLFCFFTVIFFADAKSDIFATQK